MYSVVLCSMVSVSVLRRLLETVAVLVFLVPFWIFEPKRRSMGGELCRSEKTAYLTVRLLFWCGVLSYKGCA